ncbi:hypothetical protein HELRODRAFT_161598 [Helobdella robusta]|uniref:Thyroglobulin type-1 domain-containing protein n=1 Tax=Helobdella robusta TaxID=6412 RepID=T1ERP2_HELRO|nr:hypothetical protein HELRODRAFT_161598 [Helobdella robusta]ESO02341.1 hypothetical protein HELRODRAFT_161598 [Helobdella robusta]
MSFFIKLFVVCHVAILFQCRQVVSGGNGNNNNKANLKSPKIAKPNFSTSLESNYYDEGEGSGMNKNDNIDDNSYDDDDKTDGSAYGSGDDMEPVLPKRMTKCLRMLEDASSPGSYMPRCTYDGQFDALQCHGSECWCSTPSGQKIPGTTKKDPDTPKCNTPNNKDSSKQIFQKSTKQSEVGATASSSSAATTTIRSPHGKKQHSKNNNNNVHIVVDGVKTHDNKDTDLNAPYDNIGTRNKNLQSKKPTLRKIFPNRNNNNMNNNLHLNISTDSHNNYAQRTPAQTELRSTISQLISQPGVLAGIICIGAVTLLCFLTILTYTIFKLRRRSYSKEMTQTKPVVKVNSNMSSDIIIHDTNSYYRNGGTGSHVSGVGGGFGDIYTGGGFNYTPGYSPARCNTMSNKMSPWSPVNGVISSTTVRNSAGYSKCLDRNFYA